MPKLIGKYEILTTLGNGAMGVVYQARDPIIDRIVAVKVLSPSLLENPKQRERFYQEARTAGNLRHPNIVVIFDCGEHEGTPYIVMEYLDGEDLREQIERQTAWNLGQKLNVISQICSGLKHAHSKQVVHRDMKPGNVRILPDGTVKILDFGIARLTTSAQTQTSSLLGTVSYMSPELCTVGVASPATDLWAVGVILYELLCFRRPFEASHNIAVIHRIVSEQPAAITDYWPECPKPLQDIVRKALEKDVERRYRSADEFRAEIDRFAATLPAAETQPTVIAPAVEPTDRLNEQSDWVEAPEASDGPRSEEVSGPQPFVDLQPPVPMPPPFEPQPDPAQPEPYAELPPREAVPPPWAPPPDSSPSWQEAEPLMELAPVMTDDSVPVSEPRDLAGEVPEPGTVLLRPAATTDEPNPWDLPVEPQIQAPDETFHSGRIPAERVSRRRLTTPAVKSRKWLLWAVPGLGVVLIAGVLVVLNQKPAAPPSEPPPTSVQIGRSATGTAAASPGTGAVKTIAPALATFSLNVAPWAEVISVTDSKGKEVESLRGRMTPTRLLLPPGRYSVVVRNRQVAPRDLRLAIEVPQKGGELTTSFPDYDADRAAESFNER